MNRMFKLKINGESPKSLFLAVVFAKLKFDVYLYNFSINSNLKKYDQIILFSNFSKYILSKFDIWDEIENISYGLTSFSIIDNLISEQLLLQTEDFSNKNLNNIGWTAKYSDIKSLLINKLINYDNVYFISKNQLIDQSLIFDYEFIFKDYENILNLFKFPLSIFKRVEEQTLIFNVYLRGHIEKSLYKINTSNGLVVLTPLNRNLYQIIWYNPSLRIKELSMLSKSFFLDNLTTLLPYELKIDQIIGNLNFLHVSNNYSAFLNKSKSIYINENIFNPNAMYNLNSDINFTYIIQICNFLDNNRSKNIRTFKKFDCNFLYRKFFELKVNFSFANSIINLFTSNNIFSLSLRKFLFILLKRINLLKLLFIKKIVNSNINF